MSMPGAQKITKFAAPPEKVTKANDANNAEGA